MIFEMLLSKMSLMTNDNANPNPKNLLFAGMLATLTCFIMLMILAGFEVFEQQYATKIFDVLEFSKISGLMSLVILPASFMGAMFLVFTTKLISYLFKINTEGKKWVIGLLLGMALGVCVYLFSGKLMMILIFALTGLWGASFVSMFNLDIVQKDKIAEAAIAIKPKKVK